MGEFIGMINPRLRRLEMQTDPTFERVDYAEMAIVPLDLDAVKVRAIERAAQWRYARETGGTTLDGMAIATDREAQTGLARILLAYNSGMGPDASKMLLDFFARHRR